MKRRTLLKKTSAAIAAAFITPVLPILEPNPTQKTHFIAIGNSGGRILNALHQGHCCGKYTWIKDQYNTKSEVPNLNRIEVHHPYSSDYLTGHRIEKMPESIFDQVPCALDFIDPTDRVIILTLPTCYLSKHLAPLYANHFKSIDQPFYCIAALPFTFYDIRSRKTAAKTLSELGVHEGKLTVIISDFMRTTGDKLNMAQAQDLLFQRFQRETTSILQR